MRKRFSPLFIGFCFIFCLSLLTFAAFQSVQAQSTDWGSCTGGLCYTGGNVGINNLAPGTKLDVSGPIRTITTTGGATFVAASSGGGSSFGMAVNSSTFFLGKTVSGPGSGVYSNFVIYPSGDMCIGYCQ
jgi:hypothetical protein